MAALAVDKVSERKPVPFSKPFDMLLEIVDLQPFSCGTTEISSGLLLVGIPGTVMPEGLGGGPNTPVYVADCVLFEIPGTSGVPPLYPGTFPEIMAPINEEYLLAMSVGITASPGESIAGTTSPAPFGPGTETTPLA